MKAATRAQQTAMRVCRVGQAGDGAFHPPFGHALARMLARLQPDGQRAFADFQTIDRPAIKAMAQTAIGDVGVGCGLGDEVLVALGGIGREIGEVGDVAFGGQRDGQRAIVLAGIPIGLGAGPEMAIRRDTRAIARPAARISGRIEPGDLEHHLLVAPAGQAEMEPLEEVARMVAADGEACGGAGNAQHLDIA